MSIQAVAEILEALGGQASISPEVGAFHARVMDHIAAQLDDLFDDPEEVTFDAEILILSDPDPRNISVTIRTASPDFDATLRVYAYQLSNEELRFLLNTLLVEKRKLEEPRELRRPKVVIRKKSDSSYDLSTAAQKLDVSTEWFKKTIPCTGYTSEEQGDGSTVHQFRYRKEIVDTLSRMRDRADVAGLEYIAQTCCEGDLDWARDITGSLRDRWSERHPLQSIPASSST
jgi:hypothetical protein